MSIAVLCARCPWQHTSCQAQQGNPDTLLLQVVHKVVVVLLLLQGYMPVGVGVLAV